MKKFLRCLAGLGLVTGVLAMHITPASAVMSPPNGVAIQTGNMGGQIDCSMYFAQGNSGGYAYAKAVPLSRTTCFLYTANTFNCPLDASGYSGNHCNWTVRIAYRNANGTTGQTWTPITNFYDWNYAVGPYGSTLLSSQIYVSYWNTYDPNSCNGPVLPSCDPLVADANPTWGPFVTLRAYYSGI